MLRFFPLQRRYLVAVILTFSLCAGCSEDLPADTARLIRVIDGDSYFVSWRGKEEQIRAIGIDAPEGSAGAITRRGEDKNAVETEQELLMGRLAAEHAASLLPRNGEIRLVFDPANAANDHRDRFGRILAFIYVPARNGQSELFINEKMIEDGFAQALTRFRYDERIKDRLISAEQRARRRDAGIWRIHPDVFE